MWGWRLGAGLLAVALAVVGESMSASWRSEETAGAPPGIGQSRAGGSAGRDDRVSARVVRRVGEPLEAAFSVFRSHPEGLPTGVTRALGEPTYGASWSLAQRLRATPLSVWAVPGDGYVCLVDRGHGGGPVGSICSTTGHAVERGVFITSTTDISSGGAPRARSVVGLVPDGVRRVRVHTPGLPVATVPAGGNVFVLRDMAAEPPRAVALVR